ncbi:MAG: hypothetical protein O7G84_01145 [Gammaproteobacteria bacterium]|nr:hypothetical protein [Gammaproteobacteria bacterium]
MSEQLDMLQGDLDLFVREQRVERDSALNMLEKTRKRVIEVAREIAVELVGKHGEVTSPHVLRVMRERGHGNALDAVDARFMGAVFRAGWLKNGYRCDGASHNRPVAVWIRSPEGV